MWMHSGITNSVETAEVSIVSFNFFTRFPISLFARTRSDVSKKMTFL